MSIDDTDVLARLRAGSDTVEERQFDAHEVLAGSRRALRRRRSWQAVGACTTAALVAFSLAVAGPVPVPGLGDVTLPGSEEVRELLGLAEADASGCEVPEPAVRRTPEPETPANMRPRVTYHLTDARPLSTCFDVRIDDVIPSVGRTPDTLTEDGAFWALNQSEDKSEYYIAYHGFGAGSGSGLTTGDENTLVTGMAVQGFRVVWYELNGKTPDELAEAPYTLRTASTAAGDVRSIAEVPRGDTDNPTMTDERIAWRHGTTVSVVPVDGSAPPEPLARQATAVGSDSDEIVVATRGQDADGFPTTVFTSYGDDGSVTTLLTINGLSDAAVSLVDVTDDVLAYAVGGDMATVTVVPRVDDIADPDKDQSAVVQLRDNGVDSLSAAGDAVTWVSGPVAYLLRDTAPGRAGGPDLVRVGQSGPKERMMIGLAGDRIAWRSTTEGSDVMVNVGTLLVSGEQRIIVRMKPVWPSSPARQVPAAPTVTVPEDAVFRTND